MKKKNLLLLFLLINGLWAYAQTATNFIGTDCSGASHNLFSEMDAGKVIVVSFVMPCGACAAPSQAAQTKVQSYATSHPGKVVFYVVDDNGGTNCTTLSSWATTNGLTSATVFSNSAFKQADYPGSSTAMPKVVVMGGSNHHVFFYEDNSLNATNLQTAINSALATTSVQKVNSDDLGLSIFPNPAKDNISLNYSLTGSADVVIDVYNIIGAKVLSLSRPNQGPGSHNEQIAFNNKLSSGIYFVKVNTDGSSATLKFVVDK